MSDQEENELVMALLRGLYEERQRSHQHTLPGESKQVTFVHMYCTRSVFSLYYSFAVFSSYVLHFFKSATTE